MKRSSSTSDVKPFVLYDLDVQRINNNSGERQKINIAPFTDSVSGVSYDVVYGIVTRSFLFVPESILDRTATDVITAKPVFRTRMELDESALTSLRQIHNFFLYGLTRKRDLYLPEADQLNNDWRTLFVPFLIPKQQQQQQHNNNSSFEGFDFDLLRRYIDPSAETVYDFIQRECAANGTTPQLLSQTLKRYIELPSDENCERALTIAENISNQIANHLIVTTYNSLPYIIEYIDFFSDTNSRAVEKQSLVEYMKHKWNVDIQNERQPLICVTNAGLRSADDSSKRPWIKAGLSPIRWALHNYRVLHTAAVAKSDNELTTSLEEEASKVAKLQKRTITLVPEFCGFSSLDPSIAVHATLLSKALSIIQRVAKHSVQQLSELERLLGVSFRNRLLLRQAVTHSTYSMENERNSGNERLEFLGDCVLDVIAVDYLFHAFPLANEKQLTDMRIELVNNELLHSIATRLHPKQTTDNSQPTSNTNVASNETTATSSESPKPKSKAKAKAIETHCVYQYLLKGVNQNSPSMAADLCEALIGAIYLDRGFQHARRFCHEFIFANSRLPRAPQQQLQKQPMDASVDSEHMLLLNELEHKIGIQFTDKSLLLAALTHSSYRGLLQQRGVLDPMSIVDYERLEFLGDSVLKFVVGSHMFCNYPTASERSLTLARQWTVDNIHGIPEAAEALNLIKYARHALNTQSGATVRNLISDMFEALIGAIFIDKGGIFPVRCNKGGDVECLRVSEEEMEELEDSAAAVNAHLSGRYREYDVYGGFIHRFLLARTEAQYNPDNVQAPAKGDLQSLTQIYWNGILPVYTVIAQTEKCPFTVEVRINDVVFSQGSGNSKREAETDAAAKALEICRLLEKRFPQRQQIPTQTEALQSVVEAIRLQSPHLVIANSGGVGITNQPNSASSEHWLLNSRTVETSQLVPLKQNGTEEN